MERTPQKYFRGGSKYSLISKWLKPHKDNKKQKKGVSFSETGNCASQK